MRHRTSRAKLMLAATALGLIATSGAANDPSTPQTYSARDEQAQWIDDPHFHAFYEATLEAFAEGPDRIDRAAYQERSREIFRSLAMANDIPVEGFLDHMSAIPGEMVSNILREPEILESYDNFVEALFGPQSFPEDAVE